MLGPLAVIVDGRDVTPRRAQQRAVLAELLRGALALWRGDPLAEFRDRTFARAAIADMEELGAVATEERIQAELDLGHHAELIAELERRVRAQPLRERLRGQLMLALY